MPLAEDEEARGKCGFKLIEYMSVGVPVVCSPVGANLDIVAARESGFFATDEDGWVASGGDRTVAMRYSVAVVAPRLGAVLRRAVGQAPLYLAMRKRVSAQAADG